MVSLIWISASLFSLIKAENLVWPHTEYSPDCPQCKSYVRRGANFSSVIMADGKLVIGARNAIFRLDFAQETVNYFPDKDVPPENFDTCTNQYGQNEEDCQNYYKVILRLRNNDLFICGTEGFKPTCSVRLLADLTHSSYKTAQSGICPASPHSPTSYLMLSDVQHVGFAATSMGVGRTEYTIQRIDLNYGSAGPTVRTKTEDNWLKSPDFLYSFERGDYVYFIFKEIASELYPEQIVSRVARICKSDQGSHDTFFKENFLTFVKARMKCTYTREGSSPYTFDSISGAYFLNNTLYALFTGSNSIVETGSVLCTFGIEDINKAFTSNYLNFKKGNWKHFPNPEPFTCDETRSVYDVLDKGLLMTQVIASPNVLMYSELELSTAIAVEMEMIGQDSAEHFITIYAGSSGGKVLKMGVLVNDYGETRTTKVRTSDTKSGAIEFLVKDDLKEGAVYSVSQDSVTYFPLDTECSLFSTCQTCQDAYPGCGWCFDTVRKIGMCSKSLSCNATEKDFYGPFSQCPALPSFKKRPHDVEVDDGDTAEFSCAARNENTILDWEKVQGHLPYDKKSVESGNLLIRGTASSDIGCYRCVLRGVSGTAAAEACLSVRIPLKFTLLPTNNELEVDAGADVIIPCMASGNPKPKYSWRKLGAGKLPETSAIQNGGSLKLIRVINLDEGTYRCTANNSVGSISQDILLKVVGKVDPESGSINGDEGYDLTIIAAAVGVVLIIILFVGIGVKVFINRNNNKKGSQYSSVPGEGEHPALRYPSMGRAVPGVPGSSLPTHLHSDLYCHPSQWPPQSSTIAIGPSRQHTGSPGFPTSLLDRFVEQPPPPYQPHLLAGNQPHLLAGLPENYHQEHEYDEINIMIQQQRQQQYPDMLTPNGYNSTFQLNQGLMGRLTPPSARPPVPGRNTPPQIPERTNTDYDVMCRESPHRLNNISPLASTLSPTSQGPPSSPWGQNSDI